MTRWAYWCATLLLATLVIAKFDRQTGFTSLIRFGESWEDRRHPALANLPIATVPRSNGYDGQFYAQIALDPLLLHDDLVKVIDAPAYRARRILVPAAAALLGLGFPWWTIQIYSLVNVLFWIVLGLILYRQIDDERWTGFARWLGCMFSLGVLESVRQSLVDLPALTLLALSVTSHLRSKTTASSVWQGLGHLAKETNLLGSLALAAGPFSSRAEIRKASLRFALAALPLTIWSVYVHFRLGGSPLAGGVGNFSWPLSGLVAQAGSSAVQVAGGNLDGRYTFALLAITGFAAQVASLWCNRQWAAPWWRIGAAYSVLLLVLGPWVWSGYWAACRAVLPMTIAFNLLLPKTRWFWPCWIVGNLTALHGVWRFL